MLIAYDKNMPYAQQVLAALGDICTLDELLNDLQLQRQCQALAIRSTTQVNRDLLTILPNLKMVGTATAGYDHIDTQLLKQHNIAWYRAAGCNAEAVAEYTLNALLHTLVQHGRVGLADSLTVFAQFTVAVVGVGQVGSRVAKKLQALGMSVILYDPPRSDAGELAIVEFSQVLAADIICCHTPLVKDGLHPTAHLFSELALRELDATQILLNAGRGEVIDTSALLALQETGQGPLTILDVWENEPHIERRLITHCVGATAHIAGHSLEGKARGTFMVGQFFASQLDVSDEVLPDMQSCLPPAHHLPAKIINRLCVGDVLELVNNVVNFPQDDSDFREKMSLSQSFQAIRQAYRQVNGSARREFAEQRVSGDDIHVLYELGFTIDKQR